MLFSGFRYCKIGPKTKNRIKRWILYLISDLFLSSFFGTWEWRRICDNANLAESFPQYSLFTICTSEKSFELSYA
jgi:hypothetical protein